jgi:hypothetical protein
VISLELGQFFWFFLTINEGRRVKKPITKTYGLRRGQSACLRKAWLTETFYWRRTDALSVGVNKKTTASKNTFRSNDTQSYTSYTYMGAYQYRTYPTLNLRNKQISVLYLCFYFLEFSVLSWFLQGWHYEPQNKVHPSYELTRKMHIPSFPYNQYCNKKKY